MMTNRDWGLGARGWRFRKWVGLGFLLSISSLGPWETAAVGETETTLPITVLVYNYAQVPVWTLATAEKRVASIFREVGLGIVWCNVALGMAETQGERGCNQRSGRLRLELRIVPWLKDVPGEIRDSTMGYAAGDMATVSRHWVEHAAPSGVAMPTEILACAVAHEIGHILLGPNSHSATGIMRMRWSPQDLQGAGWGRLLFTPQQAEVLRTAVQARRRFQQTGQIASAAHQE